VSIVCCQVEVSATSRSLDQRRSPRPTRAVEPEKNFSPSLPALCHHCSRLIFNYMLLLPQGHTVDSCERSHIHKMLFHKSGNTVREGGLTVFHPPKCLVCVSKLTHAALTYADSDRYQISQVPETANQQSTRMAYRSGCMRGSATFCHFHSDTVRDTAGPVRTGQDKICDK
jgi:hypothetical protein